MITFEGLEENLKFITMEVENQVRSVFTFIRQPTRTLYENIITKDDYIDNLKAVIENKCFSKIHTDKSLTKREINRIRSIQIISVNLERIADFCVNIARQMSYLTDHGLLERYEYKEMGTEIQNSLSKILTVLSTGDLSGALSICKTEYTLDQMYKLNFDRIMKDIEDGLRVPELITILFIFRYIERLGDALLNVGEALIFSIIGEKIKIEQFDALRNTLAKSGFKGSVTEIDFQSIWGTRSGCRIGRVNQKETPEGQPNINGGIFKEGAIKKIAAEKENLENWNRIFPGLAARIYGYNEDGESASLLVEFLPGCTLDELILSADAEIIDNVLFVLSQTLFEIWKTTKEPSPVHGDYTRQILNRKEAILRVHPGFSRPPACLAGREIDSSVQLMSKCQEIESGISAPFGVLIHGDFNVNNILYDHVEQRIHLLDLYRSKLFDYVQDVSVFLVSNFRIPVFESGLRDRLNHIIKTFYHQVRHFANTQGDGTFDIRMAFALARSFYTSTRYELKAEFAREMFLRSHFLQEKIATHSGQWSSFVLPEKILYY